jgi:CheY-like chemotaxis protein
MNLAINARDAMPTGGKLVIETAAADLDEKYARKHGDVEPGPYVMFAVSDTGMGMDPETRSQIFDPFFTSKEKGRGTGLGLATVYGIVKQHQGHIAVYTEVGKGTTFKVYLPRETEDAPDELPKAAVVAQQPFGTETVLIVEDEEVVRDLLSETLGMWGYRTIEAGSPQEALNASEQHQGPINLLLTDVVLPQMDGKSLFDLLSQTRPEMKVLYMSGYTDEAIVRHGVLDRGVPFLQKPFTVHKLAGKMREVLRTWRLP